jgi:hypothetical protein
MSSRRKRRVTPAQFSDDYYALVALRDMPHLAEKAPDLSVEELNEQYNAAINARETVLKLQQALEAARDTQVETDLTLHDSIILAKNRIISVFGRDSLEVQKIGLKRISEYRRPTRRTKQI